MSRDHLTQAHKNSLAKNEQPIRRTTLTIKLGDGSTLDFATADCEYGSKIYLGKLAIADALNMELTGVTEGQKFAIDNTSLALGHNLINTPDILTGLEAMSGCYFLDDETDEEFHDEKIPGRIEVGDIDEKAVQIIFRSLSVASEYEGELISEAFPDEEVPVAQIPAPVTPEYPVYDDLPPVINNFGGGLSSKFNGRYDLPQQMEIYVLN